MPVSQEELTTHRVSLIEPILLEDFAQWTHPVSSDWTHLAWVTGGAAGKEFYASFLREASFLALTPR